MSTRVAVSSVLASLIAVVCFAPLTAFASFTWFSSITSASQVLNFTSSSIAADEVCWFQPDGSPVPYYISPSSGPFTTTLASLNTDYAPNFQNNYPTGFVSTGTGHAVEVVRALCSGDWYTNECSVSYSATISGCSGIIQNSTYTWTPPAVTINQWVLTFLGWF